MKKYSEVSRRYAKALFELVEGNKKSEETLKQLRKAQEAVRSPKIKELLSSPVLSRKEKVLVVGQLVSHLQLNETLENLLSVLADKNRMDRLDEVVLCFENINDEKNNVLRGEVVSASELSDKDKSEIEASIAKFTGYQLLLEYKKDPALIGGVLAKAGSYTFDGSLSAQLTKLKEQVSNQ